MGHMTQVPRFGSARSWLNISFSHCCVRSLDGTIFMLFFFSLLLHPLSVLRA